MNSVVHSTNSCWSSFISLFQSSPAPLPPRDNTEVLIIDRGDIGSEFDHYFKELSLFIFIHLQKANLTKINMLFLKNMVLLSFINSYLVKLFSLAVLFVITLDLLISLTNYLEKEINSVIKI